MASTAVGPPAGGYVGEAVEVLTMRRIVALAAVVAVVALVAPAGRAAATEPTLRRAPDGTACEPIAVPTATPVATSVTSPCPGVRPGALIEIVDVGFCSLNFLFRGGDGATYAGTAGHCARAINRVDEQTGPRTYEHRWAPNTGPLVNDGDGRPIGRFYYARLDDRFDFGLIRLRAGVRWSPQMCHFGGPTDVYRGRGTGIVHLRQYGQGVGVGDVVPGRPLVSLRGTPDPYSVHAQGLVLPGDSGSPVITADGRAVGVAVTVGLYGEVRDGVPMAATVGISRLAHQVDRAAAVLGYPFWMMRAPLR